MNDIEYMQEVVKRGEALTRLKNNPDFKTIILSGYLVEEVLATTDMLTGNQEQDKQLHDAIDCIMHFKRWLTGIETEAEKAKSELLGEEY